MRKKSHISLGRYLVEATDVDLMNRHKKAFCIGNVLPDCKPSFLTTKHEFNVTFHKVKEDIKKLVEFDDKYSDIGRVFFRDLGQVIHYIADYFTFPHNEHYPGTLKDHCTYENELKHQLREFLRNGEARRHQSEGQKFDSLEELIGFVKDMHKEYTRFQRSVKEDCIFIVTLCSQVVFGVLYLLGMHTDGIMVPAFA